MDPVPKPVASKEFITFCNSLRCPLCGSQLDGNIHPKKAKLYCVSNNAEYVCTFEPDNKLPKYEQIMHWFSQYEYVVTSLRLNEDLFEVKINRFDRDVAEIHKNSTIKNVFNKRGDRILFFRERMDEPTFNRKLKLYNIFS